MNLGRRMVHQPYHGSFEIIHYPNHQVHHNPRVLDHVLLVIDYTKASQSNYYIITTGKLNADWSNKQYLQHNKSCNKAHFNISIGILFIHHPHKYVILIYIDILLIMNRCLNFIVLSRLWVIGCS